MQHLEVSGALRTLKSSLGVKRLIYKLLYCPYIAWRKDTNKMQQYRWFTVNSRCWLLTTVSTCFGHLYAHHQEKRPCFTAYGVYLLVVLDVAVCGTVVLRCRVWSLWRLLFDSLHVSTLLCHLQGVCSHYLAKLHKCQCTHTWYNLKFRIYFCCWISM